ncbi:hypothetical protein JW962_03730 [Candidatus Dojkabacteria bacterium]|nr:hypothetical protein [Candidatus Dojkabacteria bacterium]
MLDIDKIIMQAAPGTSSASGVSTPSGVPQTLAELVQRALTPIFAVAGVVLLGLFIYGGYTWLMSAGDPGKLKEAQGIIVNAIIGIAIVMSAALLTRVVGHLLGYEGMGIF